MSAVKTDRRDGILTITFDNPPDGLLTGAMVETLLGVVEEAGADDAVRCLLLRGGVPGVFIRHYSVQELKGLSDSLRAKGKTFDETSPVDDHGLNRVTRALEAMPKPVIAAINGHAMGGGWELAMAADIRVAEDGDFSLGLPEVNLGILPGAGGTQRLARLVGVSRALEMALRGRTVGPGEALALGMVHEVADDAVARSAEIAAELAGKPARALGHIKRLIRAAKPPIDPDVLALESRLFLDLAVSDEANERMAELVAGRRDIREP